MPRRPLAHVLVLTAALLLGAGPYLVRAAGHQQPPPARIVANVDFQQVFAESEARKTAAQKVRQYAGTISQRFDETSRLHYLSTEEIGEYSEALNAEKPTDAQKQRIEALQKEAVGRAEEYRKLSTAKDADLMDKDRARLRELSTLEQQRPQSLEGLRRIYQNFVQDEDAKQTRQAQAEVRALINKMAKEQGFNEVYDSSTLIVAPTDLTQQAVSRVKKAR